MNPTRHNTLQYVFFIFCLVSCSCISHAQQKKYIFERPKMGSPLRIVMYCDDSLRAATLADKAFALADTLNAVFSDYDPSSELSKLNRSSGNPEPVFVSPMLLGILKLSKEAYEKSNKAFDASVGPLSITWRKARKEKRFPENEIAQARKLVGFNRIAINFKKNTVWLPEKGMSLDFGGIAKGYVASLLLQFLTTQGIRQSLVDAGGDMDIGDAPPGTDGWQIGVGIPEPGEQLFEKRLILKNTAVATSGSVYQYFEHEGKKYSHIIDPRTGYGITSPRNVTIITKDAWVADWLATACSILPIEEAKKIARKNMAELLITESDNGRFIYHSTKGFYSFWK